MTYFKARFVAENNPTPLVACPAQRCNVYGLLCLLCLLPIRSDGMFITSNMCVFLIAAQISFIGSENTGYPEQYMCKIATCVIHYFFMCVHFSSFAHALHLWSKFAPMCVETCRRRGVYVFTIWIVPALVVIATTMLSGDLYASEERCWLPSERNTRMAFLFPVFLIQVANWILFVMILRAGIMLDMTKGKDKRTILRHICLSSLSMFPVFGLQWTLGYAVTFNLPIAFQFAFVVLASAQIHRTIHEKSERVTPQPGLELRVSGSLKKKLLLDAYVMYNPVKQPSIHSHYNKSQTAEQRQEKQSKWPPGPYAIPMSRYGCPESWSRGWSKGFLKINMTVLDNSLESNSSVSEYNSVNMYENHDFFNSPFRSEDVKIYFCVKFRNEVTLDQEQWIPGNYSIFKIGSSCPTDFEESSKTLPVPSHVSYGLVPNITVPKGSSEEFINISMCKRKQFTDTRDNNTIVTFKMLETDFILEKAMLNYFLFSITLMQSAIFTIVGKLKDIDLGI
ncbi:adhesion G protein-coupled receptor L1-like [Ruditapes philippinarum]|uniref:adhesion G protein-coupled receptor L1-like n=1 Tax=Ruditapes philippinarum TaxID=129788 RepID=UPI00295A640F|nr:adhesion G protein-coupled receptor L1-like [Ruditapes philippinarum]